jgi:hypothetical protein
LNERLDNVEAQQRGKQSDTDRGYNNLKKQLDEQAGEFAKILEYGAKYDDPVDAERNYKMDQMLGYFDSLTQGTDSLAQISAQQKGGSAGQSSDAGNVDPEVLKRYGVDPQSPEYLAQVEQGKVGLEAALEIVAARQAGGAGDSATGASGGSGGGSASTATQQQVLRDQYNAELDEAAKLTHGVLKPQALYQIQVKYAGLGLQGVL